MRLRHVISTEQFLEKDMLLGVFERADALRNADANEVSKTLEGKLLASVFYEPSTRTRFSFEAAMLKLGGEVVSTESAGHFSSAIKGESLEDTVRIIGSYTDVIVLRHPEVGAAERAAKISPVPVINAGDGAGEHPTQALLDLYTIKREFGKLDGFAIGMVGDLRYGRTIHSLIHLLSLSQNIRVFLVSPKELRLPEQYRSALTRNAIEFHETEHFEEILAEVDILYVTRVQKERFDSPELYERVKDSFILDERTLARLPARAVIMHPLPRVHEISTRVDADSRAAYFRQAQNGLYVRMALLQLILGSS